MSDHVLENLTQENERSQYLSRGLIAENESDRSFVKCEILQTANFL